MNLSSLFGTAIGMVGLVFGWIQYQRTKRIEQRHQEQLRVFINRANYVSWDHRMIDHYVKGSSDPSLGRWLWLNHQAGCDLYMGLVDAYLSREARFTFDDLKRIAQGPLVGGAWQERYWLSLLALRPENRTDPVPPTDDYPLPPRVEILRAQSSTADELPGRRGHEGK